MLAVQCQHSGIAVAVAVAVVVVGHCGSNTGEVLVVKNLAVSAVQRT